jgi:16S rRNA (uracil1498-N3)-methyltransferase
MMPRIFVPAEPVPGEALRIGGEDGHHFTRVLRARIGEVLAVTGGGRAYLARILDIDKAAGELVVIPESPLPSHESRYPVYLVQGLAKGDKIETIVQKATEIGVAGFLLMQTARSVVRFDRGRKAAKQDRWQRVAKEAAAQAQRDVVPVVEVALTETEVAAWLRANGISRLFLLDEAEERLGLKQALRQVTAGLDGGGAIAIAVGPEGGWDDAERILWRAEFGAVPVTLGPRILRTETAGIAAAAAILYELDQLGG